MLTVLPIHEPIKDVLAKGVPAELLWGFFANEAGSFTVGTLIEEPDHDDGVEFGTNIHVVYQEIEAGRLCRHHNAAVVNAFCRTDFVR